jgi:hypothetical protein
LTQVKIEAGTPSRDGPIIAVMGAPPGLDPLV